jgi:hypothetical protein
MESLHITDKYHPKRAKKINITDLDNEFFADFLARKCPNLRLISLEYLDLSQVDFSCFLSLMDKLETFSLRWCKISPNWLDLRRREVCSF